MLDRTRFFAGQPQSIWKAAAPDLTFKPLRNDVEADVAIVGGGITGVLCAWLLSEAKLKVVLLEALRIGEGSTGNSTGNLYAVVGSPAPLLRDKALAGRVVRTRAAAIDLIESIAQEQHIECGFIRAPWTLFSPPGQEPAELDPYRELAEAGGLRALDARGDMPMPARAAIRIEQQAQFNPLAFTKILAMRCQAAGCSVFEQSPVLGIEPGEVCTLATATGSIRARWVILATHTPKGVLKIQTLLAPYREHGIAVTLKDRMLPTGIFWSAGESHHSLRSCEFGGRAHLIVVGETHKTGQGETEEHFRNLMSYAEAQFPVDSPRYRWSAQAYAAADGMPYIGESALGENVLLATGFAADGLTYAGVAAPILADAVCGRRNETAPLFASGRFAPRSSAKRFLRENLNVARQFLKDLPGRVDADSFSDIGRGEGKTVSAGGEKLAAYRDLGGGLHVVSAVCTHMRCVVAWNAADASWDCPCHGSRFTVDGAVIEGPALSALPARDKGER